MDEKNKTKIGKITDAHGIKGEIAVFVFSGNIDDESSWYNQIQELTLSFRGRFETFKILRKRIHKKGFICLLENFLDRNKAEYYSGCEVWIDSSYFVSQDGEALYLSEILHFEVSDELHGLLGIIEGFSFNGIQDLLIIKKLKKADIEIPFVKEFVKNIDYKNKKIVLSLPEGLLEINDAE